MSEFRSHQADLAAAHERGRAPGFARTASYAPATPAGVAALAGARDALRAVPVSREALRAQVVRYAAGAREQGASAAEVTDALDLALAPALAGFPAAVAQELRVHVGWWAAHGYHRAD